MKILKGGSTEVVVTFIGYREMYDLTAKFTDGTLEVPVAVVNGESRVTIPSTFTESKSEGVHTIYLDVVNGDDESVIEQRIRAVVTTNASDVPAIQNLTCPIPVVINMPESGGGGSAAVDDLVQGKVLVNKFCFEDGDGNLYDVTAGMDGDFPTLFITKRATPATP